MKKMSWALLASLSLIFISVSCEDEPDEPTKTEMMTSASWKYESATYNGAAVPPSMTACVVDNTLTFTSTTYTVTEGAVVCVPSTATATPQAWSFQSNDTQLVLASSLIPGTPSGTFTLVSLTATNLVISQNVVIPPSPTAAPLVITFKH